MNKELFNSYLDDQSLLDAPSIAELQLLVEHYPYFQTARLLYLKSLHENKSTSYPGELKVTAIYAGDRSVLFRLVKKNTKPGQTVSSTTVAPASNVTYQPGEATRTYENLLIEHIAQAKPTSEVKKAGDSLLDFDYVAKPVEEEKPFDVFQAIYSTPDSIQPQIIEYLQADAKAHENENEPADQAPKKMRYDLIDKFIEKNPRIVPKEILPTATYDLSEESVKESNELITETLAEIYIKQKKYGKAIQIYEKLALKYPQKSIYFADSIEKIKELMNNDKQ